MIPCRNEAAHIEACLTAVLNQHAPDGGFEVIVADGMSDDGTREILARLAKEVGGQLSEVNVSVAPSLLRLDRGEGQGEVSPSSAAAIAIPSASSHQPSALSRGPTLRVIDNPGRIVSKGLNAAILASRGDIIVRMDAHTQYAPDYLARCVQALEETGADNVGGPWVASGEGCISKAIAAAFQSPFAVGGARGHDPAHQGLVDTVYLGCWRKVAFEKFGFFDEELVRNQDDEHNLRIIRGGGKIYQSPNIMSRYRPRGSLKALCKQYMQYGYWKVRVIQKHRLPASFRHLVPGVFVLTIMLLFLLSALTFLSASVSPRSSILYSLSSWLLMAILGLYAACVVAASFVTAAKTGWKLFWILPLVFPCYHCSYGYGFLRGVWDFVIRRRGTRETFSNLTR